MNEEAACLAFLIREGPEVGVSLIVQVDNIDGFSRCLDDALLKEFSHRVAAQMSGDSSVKLLGSSQASRLGDNRALLLDDVENRISKFKPYELPNLSWASNKL